MLEKNGFFAFGNTLDESDMKVAKGEGFANFVSPLTLGVGAVIVARGRKKRADKNRQEIQDKYANLDVACGGIDGSISMVSKDLDNLKANKPQRKLLSKKDELAWQARVSETESVLNEIIAKKRSLICNEAGKPSTSGGVEIVQQMPSTSGGTATMLQPTTKTGAISTLFGETAKTGYSEGQNSGLQEGSQTPESDGAAKKRNLMWLYIVLGVVAVGGVVYFVRRRN